MSLKQIQQVLTSMPTSDGAGVNLRRAIGMPSLRNIDPFLMLDEIRSDDPNDYIAGFPPHPHKGFETLSYMLQGSMAHEDSTGGQGLISSGGVQYMTAGRGIVHSETPKQDAGLLWGFQLWLNLPAKNKLLPASYRDIPKELIPCLDVGESSRLKLIAGTVNDQAHTGPVVRDDLALTIFDITSTHADRLTFPLPVANHGFIYVYQGGVEVAGHSIESQQIAEFGEGDGIVVNSRQGAGFLLLSGKPINEPIVQHGPFVMNTNEEIAEAVHDFQTGQFV